MSNEDNEHNNSDAGMACEEKTSESNDCYQGKADDKRINCDGAEFSDEPEGCLVHGSPGSGKSFLLKQMCISALTKGEEQTGIGAVIVFTATPAEWEGTHPNVLVSEYSDKRLKALMKTMNDACKKHGEQNVTIIVIIFDDLLARLNFRTELMQELMTRYRHYRLSPYFACQNITTKIGPLIRDCCRKLITFKPKPGRLKFLYENFGSSTWSSQDDMKNDMRELDVKKHNYMILNVNSGEYCIVSGERGQPPAP